MTNKFKKYVFYFLPSLLIVTLVTSVASFFEYNRFLSQETLLENELNYNADLMTQRIEDYKSDINRMFTRLQNNSMIIQTLVRRDISVAQGLLKNETTVKPYVLGLSLLDSDGHELIYAQAKKISGSTIQTDIQRQEQQKLFDRLRKNKTSAILFSKEAFHSVAGKENLFFSRFVGENIFDEHNQYIGAILIEINMNYMVKQLIKLLPEQMKIVIIASGDNYFSSTLNVSQFCPNTDNCLRYFQDNHLLKTDENGNKFFKNEYAAERTFDLASSESQKDQEDKQLLLVQYKEATLLYDRSLFAMLWHSIVVKFSILFTSLLCALGSFILIRREDALTKQYYAERVSQAFSVISNFIERLHEDDSSATNHVHRITYYAELLAKEYGLKKKVVEQIRLFAALHDIGKIAIADSILKKENRLSDDEWNLMIAHVEVGYDIIHEFEISPVAENIARYHHEKWNGSGYGQGLSGTNIPVEARIMGVVDCYDALTTERPYKKAFKHEKACAIINSEKGHAFDPAVVDAFNRCANQYKIYLERLRAQAEAPVN